MALIFSAHYVTVASLVGVWCIKTLNNHARISLPRLWLLFLCNVNRYHVTSCSDDSNTIHQRWGQLQR